LAAPGLVLKAEAIVGPDQLVPYLGGHEVYRPECDLAYDNQLMVMLWSCLASRDTRLAVQALGRRTPKPTQAGWVTYVRCHDDIGWAVGDDDARAVGLDPFAHRRFLADFFAGRHAGSFSSGLDFQSNPLTGDARTSGAAASLAGLELALESGEPAEVQAALARIELLSAVAYSFGGIPLIYMGDEIALRNDAAWADDPAHADDNRWLHRPPMDWAAAELRTEDHTPEAAVFQALRALGAARRSSESLRSDGDTQVLGVDDPHVLAFVRKHPRAAPVVVLANFSDHDESVSDDVFRRGGLTSPRHLHSSNGRLVVTHGRVQLAAWGYVWVTQDMG